MKYNYLLAKNDICIPLEWIEIEDTYDHTTIYGLNNKLVTNSVIKSKMRLKFNNYHADFPNFPSGQIYLYSLLDQSVKVYDLSVEQLELDSWGAINIIGSVYYLGEKIDFEKIPNTLKEYIRDEKLKILGI